MFSIYCWYVRPDLDTPNTGVRISHVTSSSSFSFSSTPMTPGSDPGRIANYTLRPHHKNTMSQAFSAAVAAEGPATPTATLREKANSALHGSTSSIGSSASSKTDRDSGGTIELNQQVRHIVQHWSRQWRYYWTQSTGETHCTTLIETVLVLLNAINM